VVFCLTENENFLKKISHQEQQKVLEGLKRNLNASENLITSYSNTIQEQEKLLAGLREQLNAMYETYRKQSALSARYAQSSKFWQAFTLVAIPVTQVISGGNASTRRV